jgi:anaerobic magnesium-protoporphyrin IX monomethyl ester cyclase
MRILLINSNRFHQPWPVIPFGLCCVASAVDAAGHEVKVLDLCFARHPAKQIAGALADFTPDLVGVSIRNIDNSAGFNTLFLLDDVRANIIEPLKRAFSGPIVIGGPSVGISGAEMLDFFDLEFAIRGDGEDAMVEFLERLAVGASLNGMGGLVRRRNQRIVEDNPPICASDLDSLPPSRPYKWIDIEPYVRHGSPLQIQTKRGCALSCSYCTYNRIEGRSWRLRDPKKVVDEIETMVRESGIRAVEFTDSTFNIPLEHCKAVLREVAGRGLNLRLRTMGLNPGAVDGELAELLKTCGFSDVDVGAEAGSDETLQSLGKNFRKASVIRAGRLLRDKGIPVSWYLLVGAPAETAASLRETFHTINSAAAPWDLVNIGIGLRVYNGSPIAEQMRSEGASGSEDSFFKPSTCQPPGLSLDDLKLLTKREALKRANYFMYDEDEKTPEWLMVLGTALLRVCSPRTPVWRLFITMRNMQKLLGIAWLKRGWFEWRHRNNLARLDGWLTEPVCCKRVGNVLTGLSGTSEPMTRVLATAIGGDVAEAQVLESQL